MLYPFLINQKCGYFNIKGEVIIEPKYDSFSFFSEGLVAVFRDDISEYLNFEGDVIISNTDFEDCRDFSEGLALVRFKNNSLYGVIDKKGNVLVSPKYNSVFYTFKEGLASVGVNEKYGYIDKNGNEIIPLIYDNTNEFNFGLAIVKLGQSKFFINKKGDKLKTEKCTIVDNIFGGFKEGLAVAKYKNKYGLLNTNGDFFIKPNYEFLGGFYDGLCSFKIRDKFGFIDKYENIVIDPIYKDFDDFYKNHGIVSLDGKKWGLINKNGDFVVLPIYDRIWSFFNKGYSLSKNDFNKYELTKVELNNEIFYINFKGERIFNFEARNSNANQRFKLIVEAMKKDYIKKDVWVKAETNYDGITVTKKGALRPIYLIFKWLKSKNLLNEHGLEVYKERKEYDLDIRIDRYMLLPEGIEFMDRLYEIWYNNEAIFDFEFDTSIKFEGNQYLDEYWSSFCDFKNK